MKKIFKISSALAVLFVMVFSLFNVKQPTINAATPKELTQIVKDVKIWSSIGNHYLEPKADGSTEVNVNTNYQFELFYDLTKYDHTNNGGLNNGDYFTVAIPAPVTISNYTGDLIHKETGIVIGTLEITNAGERNGGTAKITLKNLDQYMAQKQSTTIHGVKGTAFVNFKSVDLDLTGREILIGNTIDDQPIRIKLKTVPAPVYDNSETIGKENFDKVGNIYKEHFNSPKLGKKDNYIHGWSIRLNARRQHYDELKIVDVIDEEAGPIQIIPETLIIKKGKFRASDYVIENVDDPSQPAPLLVEGQDYEVVYNSTYTKMEIKILRPENFAYSIHYKSTATKDGSWVGNKVEVYANGNVKLPRRTDIADTYRLIRRLSKVSEGGTIEIDTTYRVIVYKVDKDTLRRLPGAVFEIEKPDGSVIRLPETDGSGITVSPQFTPEEAAAGSFKLREVTPPQGYQATGTSQTFSIPSSGVIRTIKNEKIKIDIPVTKEWIGTPANEVKVNLYNILDMNTVLQTKTITANDGWTTTFTGLPKFNDDNTEAKYIVKEVPMTNYESNVTGDQVAGFKITNKNIEKIQVKVNKIWHGLKQAGVEVKIFNEKTPDQIIETKTITEAMQWKYTFENLPKFNADGTIAKYKVIETPIANYNQNLLGDQNSGFTFVNTNTEKVNVPVKKTWFGPKLARIEVKLYEESDPNDIIDQQFIDETTQWEYTFENLPKYTANGNLAKYIVKETPIANYDTQVSGDQNTGYVIKNTNTEVTELKVKKMWNGPKLNQVEVKVFNVKAPTVMIATKEISEATGWEATFDNLPKYNEDGSEAQYNVVETPVANYESETDGNQTVGFTILNTNNEKVNVPVEKRWFGPKLDKIEVKLYNEKAPTQILQQVELKEANAWKHTFMNLPKYNQDGSEAKYLVEEVKLENYTSKITGDQGSGYLITNRNIEKISIPVTKGWVGPKTSGVEVKIFHKDDEVNAIETVEITEAMNWKYVFKDLPKYNQDGSEAQYIVKETPIANYDTEVSGDQNTGYVITNTNTETVAVEVVKRWVGKALEKVEVELYQNGKLLQTFEVRESEGYKAVIKDLPKYAADGTVYVYEVKEKEVAGYESKITKVSDTSFIITNKVRPIKPKVDSGDETTGFMAMAMIALFGLVFLKKQKKH